MFSIIDIETTGLRPGQDKIIEIAIFNSDGHKVIDEFHTLIHPECRIPSRITSITGIDDKMVKGAPKFYEVARKIVEFTANRVFVAHNSSFDYRFVKAEYQALGFDYSRKNLCTVKLSREFIPARPSYSLKNICRDLNISLSDHHRAKADAAATVNLFHHLIKLNSKKSSPSMMF